MSCQKGIIWKRYSDVKPVLEIMRESLKYQMVDGIKCYLLKSTPWAERYEGVNAKGKRIGATVSKIRAKSDLVFFEQNYPENFTHRELVSIVISLGSLDYSEVSEEWIKVITNCRKSIFYQ